MFNNKVVNWVKAELPYWELEAQQPGFEITDIEIDLIVKLVDYVNTGIINNKFLSALLLKTSYSDLLQNNDVNSCNNVYNYIFKTRKVDTWLNKYHGFDFDFGACEYVNDLYELFADKHAVLDLLKESNSLSVFKALFFAVCYVNGFTLTPYSLTKDNFVKLNKGLDNRLHHKRSLSVIYSELNGEITHHYGLHVFTPFTDFSNWLRKSRTIKLVTNTFDTFASPLIFISKDDDGSEVTLMPSDKLPSEYLTQCLFESKLKIKETFTENECLGAMELFVKLYSYGNMVDKNGDIILHLIDPSLAHKFYQEIKDLGLSTLPEMKNKGDTLDSTLKQFELATHIYAKLQTGSFTSTRIQTFKLPENWDYKSIELNRGTGSIVNIAIKPVKHILGIGNKPTEPVGVMNLYVNNKQCFMIDLLPEYAHSADAIGYTCNDGEGIVYTTWQDDWSVFGEDLMD